MAFNCLTSFFKGRGFRNGYQFPEGENIVLREMDPFQKTGTALGATDIHLLKLQIVLGETDMLLEVSIGHEIDMRRTQIAVSPSQ